MSAEATRGYIIDTATELFLRHGYTATTLERVAGAAGVALQTIYNAVGNKGALLMAVFQRVVSGPEAPRPVPEFMMERAARTHDLPGMVDVLADWFVEAHARMARLWEVMAEAAVQDPAIAAFQAERSRQRLRNYGLAAAQLIERGASVANLDEGGIAALIFSVSHPRVYRTFVIEGGWSAERYRRWLRATLLSALTPGAATPPRSG